MTNLSGKILKALGWKITGTLPAIDKCVIRLAPHTSNMDFFIGRLACNAVGLKSSFLIKKEWLTPPIGWILRPMGAVGVNRGKHTSMTDTLAETFKRADKLILTITPEGTRQRNPDWKMGFYYIAKKAGIPILPVVMDFKKKEVQIKELYYPTDDEAADIKAIKSNFIGAVGKHPELFSLGEGFE